MLLLLLLLLLFNRSPDRVACQNHEVMDFQPRTGSTSVLDPVVLVKPYYLVSLLHILQPFYGSFVPPPWFTSYPPSIYHHLRLLHFCLLHPLLTQYSPGIGATVHLDVAPTCRPPPLVSVLSSLTVLDLLPRSLLAPGVLLFVPVSAVYLIHLPPPFADLDLGPMHAYVALPSPPPPPAVLDLRTIPYRYLGIVFVIRHLPCPPVPCASDSTSLCVMPYLGFF